MTSTYFQSCSNSFGPEIDAKSRACLTYFGNTCSQSPGGAVGSTRAFASTFFTAEEVSSSVKATWFPPAVNVNVNKRFTSETTDNRVASSPRTEAVQMALRVCGRLLRDGAVLSRLAAPEDRASRLLAAGQSQSASASIHSKQRVELLAKRYTGLMRKTFTA